MSTRDPHRQFAVDVVARLRAGGFRALWAGGCVRDLLLGLEPADFDVATDATPDQVMAAFRRTVPVGASFGVVRVLGPREAGEVEVATFRSDGAYRDGRHPEAVSFSGPEADAARRDFTINGMFLDPLTDEVVDLVGGRADLDRRLLRAVGVPAARFAEDKLRLLRAIRFAARFGLTIEPETWRAVVAMAPEVGVVAAERIAAELRKMLAHPTRAEAMALAADAGLVAAILPPLDRLRGRPADGPGGDVWGHTLRTLRHLPDSAGFPLAFAALVQDAGGMQAEGARDAPDPAGRAIAEGLGRDLRLANAERERAAWLVESRRTLRDPHTLRESERKRRLAVEGVADLLALHRADALASGVDPAHVAFCEEYLRDEPEGPIDPPPLLSGHDLVRLGMRAGPHFKALLDGVRDAQLERRIGSKEEALGWVARQPMAGAGGAR